jgi:hypothetical protein
MAVSLEQLVQDLSDSSIVTNCDVSALVEKLTAPANIETQQSPAGYSAGLFH